VPGVAWPALPPKVGASMLAMQFQLERSQWWPAHALIEQQFRQLEVVLAHAFRSVPFYRQRLSAASYSASRPLTGEWFHSLALTTRSELQSQFNAFLSDQLPADHGQRLEGQTSGSTGTPLRVCGTEVTHFFWGALTLRDHLWHDRDLRGKSAVIRSGVQNSDSGGWGPSAEVAFETGPTVVLNIQADIDTQLRWLQQHAPNYLLTFPENLRALAVRSIAQGIELPCLREARSFGSMLHSDTRALCAKAWGVPLTDLYSCVELGYLALQCPASEHYHVQSESLLIEILDAHGRPCAPGEIGRVVATTLHNFAMPLLRYDLGDYAEAGGPCPCGRNLPVLKRILGRQRNMLVLPDGRQIWPSFPAEIWTAVAPIRQFRLTQQTLHLIEVEYVAELELDQAQSRALIAALQERFGHPFDIALRRVPGIARQANAKYEEFVSRVHN
jgi:phenylacetate-CoA ligase